MRRARAVMSAASWFSSLSIERQPTEPIGARTLNRQPRSMPSALPAGDPVPVDGSLLESALAALTEQGFGIYLHVPFCSTRCGYCDFNTYPAAELRGQPGASG